MSVESKMRTPIVTNWLTWLANDAGHSNLIAAAPGPCNRLALSLRLDEGDLRELRPMGMRGFMDGTLPGCAYTKKFYGYSKVHEHWAWYRIPDVGLAAGKQRLTLGAIMTGANLNGAVLQATNITESQFLAASSFTGVNVTGNNMSSWNLANVNLSGADLSSANLTNAIFSTSTILWNGDTVLEHGFDAAGLPGGMAYLGL